jgi:hypothetical protein
VHRLGVPRAGGDVAVAYDGTQAEAAVVRPGGFMSLSSSCSSYSSFSSCFGWRPGHAIVRAYFRIAAAFSRYFLRSVERKRADPDGTFGPAGPACDLGTLRA